MRRYSKFWVALSGFATVFAVATKDGEISDGDLSELLVAAAVAIGVWRFRNRDSV